MEKNPFEYSISLPKNRKKTKNISLILVMTSMTMFTPNQNSSNFVVSQKFKPKSA